MTKDPQRIYCKTDKGRLEIIERQHGLQFQQRNTLILMDCAKSLGMIATAIPLVELEKTVPFLMHSGFIVLSCAPREKDSQITAARQHITTDDSNLTAAQAQPVIKPEPASRPILTQNPAVIDQVKGFMIASANTYLGLMGVDIIHRIQRCHTAEQLMAATAFWHLAFRESKNGSPFAAVFLEQVKFELKHGG